MTRSGSTSHSSSRAFWSLLVAVFLDMVGFTMIIPDIQLRAESMLGSLVWKGPVIGILLQVTFLIQLVASPRWGRWADEVGRKRIFLFCQGLSALAMLFYGLAESIALLFLSRILTGFGAANVSTAQALASESVGETDRSKKLGQMAAALSAGMIFGPAVGGWAAHLGHSRVVGLAGAAMSLLGAALVWAFVRPDGKKEAPLEPQVRQSWFNFQAFRQYPGAVPFFWISASASFALGSLEGTFGRLIHSILGYDSKEFGIIFSYEAILGVLIGAYLLGLLTKRFCETSLLRLAYVFQGFGLGLNPLAAILTQWFPGTTGMLWLLVASTFYGFGAGFVNPLLASLASATVDESRQGELFGLLQSARTAGFMVGPVLGGFFFDVWMPLPYLFAAMVCLVVAIFLPAICKCHPKLASEKPT